MKLLSSQRFLLVYAGGPDSCIEQNEFFPIDCGRADSEKFPAVGIGERRDYPMQEGCDASLRIAG